MRIAALCLAVVAALTPLASATSRSAGSNGGIYTPEQAAQGARVYAVRCAMCHGGALAGTVEVPGLTGKFMANWAGRPVGDLYDYLARAMPQMAPGSLTPQDNARLVAYLLQANGAPSGRNDLPADSARLKRIMLHPVRHP